MSRFRLSLRSWSVALLAAAAPGAAHAQPACVTGSLRSYFALASQGCTIVGADGIGALFSNFTLDPLTSPDVPRADNQQNRLRLKNFNKGVWRRNFIFIQ